MTKKIWTQKLNLLFRCHVQLSVEIVISILSAYGGGRGREWMEAKDRGRGRTGKRAAVEEKRGRGREEEKNALLYYYILL